MLRLLRTTSAHVLRHLRIGAPWVLIIDFFLVLLVAIDVWRFHERGLDLLFVIQSIPKTLPFLTTSRDVCLQTVVLLFVFPGIATLLVCHSRGIAPWLKTLVVGHNRLALWLHILIVTILAGTLVVGKSMEVVSGLELSSPTHVGPSFSPFQTRIFNTSLSTVLAGTSAFSVILSICISAFPGRTKAKAWLVQYSMRCKFADFTGDLYPVYRSTELDFNSGSLAPDIPMIRRHADSIWQAYQKLVPSSHAAVNYIKDLYLEARQLIDQKLLANEHAGHIGLELHSGTSRALETALARVFPYEREKVIILSPYEHHTVEQLAHWYRQTSCGKKSKVITLGSGWNFREKWTTQIDKMTQLITKTIRENQEAKPVVIISEVAAYTGQVLPVRPILASLRGAAQAAKLTSPSVIIDGAHAGPGPLSLLASGWDDLGDYYVVSGHKWLMSGDPSAILFYLRHGNDKANKPTRPMPYDGWSDDGRLPVATSNFQTLAGLVGALQIINSALWPDMLNRARACKRLFIQEIKDDFDVIEAEPEDGGTQLREQGSLMIAIVPKREKRWVQSKAELLGKALNEKHAHVLVFEPQKGQLWVRVSFPVFGDSWKVFRLVKVLKEVIALK